MHAKLRAGDPAAFRQLFTEHARVVYAHAFRVTGDWAAAEDIVSLTFLEAWRLRERLRDEGSGPRPWLMGIAINVLRNRGRATRRHREAMARLPAKDDVPDFADELVGRMADAQRLAAAKTALGKLRRIDREVFMLCVWSGLTSAEAARALDVAEGTVRARLSRARVRMRKLAAAELLALSPPAPENPQRSPRPGQQQGSRIAAVGPVRKESR